MVTLAQLQAEPAWGTEFIPPTLQALGVRVAQHFGVPLSNIGTRGNTSHLSGYHRSRRWIRESAYCVSRTYSTSATPGDRNGGSDDAVSALDITLPPAALYATCRRVDEAMRAGRLDQCTEWFGTFDGRVVTGWDNVRNTRTSSDSSHLFHLHLSFDRGRVAQDHAAVYEILTGDDMATVAEIWSAQFGSGTNRRTAGQLLVEAHAFAEAAAHAAGLTDTDLAAVRDAARAGVLASADDFAASVLAKLPAGTLTEADVEAAVRAVFADAGTP